MNVLVVLTAGRLAGVSVLRPVSFKLFAFFRSLRPVAVSLAVSFPVPAFESVSFPLAISVSFDPWA